MSLTIIGGTVMDVILPGLKRLPAWPEHTEFTPANLVLLRTPPLVTLGGNGANAAYVAARCGARVTLHTRLAGDAPGRQARAWLEGAGCRLRTGPRAEATALNVTASNPGMQRATFFYPGATPEMPALASVRGRRPKAVLVCGWPHPPLAEIAREFAALRPRGVLTALDCGPILGRAWSLRALGPLLSSLDLFLSNDHELRCIAGTDDQAEALRRLRRHCAGHVVIKRGGRGSLWLPAGGADAHEQPPFRVKVLNTVGAGDSFNGALLASLVGGRGFPRALRAAHQAASSVVAAARGVLGVRPPR